MDMTLKIAVFVGVKNPQQKMPELVRLLGQVELTRSGDDIPNISPQFVGEIRIEAFVADDGRVRLKKSVKEGCFVGVRSGLIQSWQQGWNIASFLPLQNDQSARIGFDRIMCVT
jgi:hypothetical protein